MSSPAAAGGSKGYDMAAAAAVIEKIVLTILNADDKTGACFAFLSKPVDEQTGPLKEICEKALADTTGPMTVTTK
jgi:hypothetical protein